MKTIVLATLMLFFELAAQCQNNPKVWFDSQYSDALYQCKNYKTLIDRSLSDCGIPTEEALAIVFPEMLRYSLWRDFFETKALEIGYVEEGRTVADFSIGWCQMKPSFCEDVEMLISQDSVLSQRYTHIITYQNGRDKSQLAHRNNPQNNTPQIRQQRINRLKQFEWQLQYLNTFVAINRTRIDTTLTNIQQLTLFAAAYNKGIHCTLEELKAFETQKTFPYGPNRKNPFGYVELSQYFYQNDAIFIYNNH